MTLARSRFAVVLALVCFALAASGANPKADARALDAGDRAMNDLFVAAKFDEAKAALELALSKCKHCSGAARAVLHRDLALVWITGLNDPANGRDEMAKARALDSSLELDPAFTTPEVQAAFDAAPQATASEKVVLDEDPESTDSAPPPKETETAPEAECSVDSDCTGARVCHGGICVKRAPSATPPRVWLSLGIVQDMTFVSGSDVCAKTSQLTSGFTCLRGNGSQYHGTPLSGAGGNPNAFAFSTTRVSLASNFRLFEDVSAGIRLAYAFAGLGPDPDGGKKFLPLQVELQGAYWLSPRAFPSSGLGTFLEVAGGVAEISGKKTVTVQENQAAPLPVNQLDNPPSQSLRAYKSAGAGFIGGGAGLFLPAGSRAGLLAGLRASALFPSPGFALSLSISGALGL